MRLLITLICILNTVNVFAQKDAFTNEINTKNGLIYFKGEPLSGTLYEYNEQGNTSCYCTLKASYKNGKQNGLSQKWYVGGNKKSIANYKNNKIEEKYSSWDGAGNKQSEHIYSNGQIIIYNDYYVNGELRINKKYSKSPYELIFEKTNHEDGTKKSETAYKNNNITEDKRYYASGNLNYHLKNKDGKLHGTYIMNYENGTPHKLITYNLGKEETKTVYDTAGKVMSSIIAVSNSKLREHLYYDQENPQNQIKGYYNKNGVKDSIWIVYDNNRNTLNQKKYNNGVLISEGDFKNNKKNGLWKEYLSDGYSQKNTLYNVGLKKESKTFNKRHLLWNQFDKTDEILILQYQNIDGTKENIVLTIDRAMTSNKRERSILEFAERELMDRTSRIYKTSLDDDALLSKKIKLSNIKFTYTKESVLNPVTKKTVLTYNGYIHLKLTMKNADNEVLFSKNYKFNQSKKLLTALLNTAISTYDTDKESAFNSALKAIRFKKLLRKHFPELKN
jgi:antitoxin component YwqK of YwqJK toxin-antitoxin module